MRFSTWYSLNAVASISMVDADANIPSMISEVRADHPRSNIPVLTTSGLMSVKTASICFRTNSVGM